MRQILAVLAAIIVAFGLGAAGFAAWLAYASLPQLIGEVRIAGLESRVTIDRDVLGIPLIAAENERDAATALGFVHAQDRLWQMEMSRRIGAGRLAEVVGEPGLGTDRFLRTLGLYRAAEAAMAHLSPAATARLEAYARGVNAVIESRSRPLPPEFLLLRHRPELWTPADSLVLVKTMALSLVESWRRELTRATVLAELPPEALGDLWPETRADAVTTIPDTSAARGPATPAPAPDLAAIRAIGDQARDLLAALPLDGAPGQGSNSWVVAGRHSASGAALFANDPHLSLGTPAHWYLASIKTPAGLVQGATLPSLPVVVIGRNESIAWGFTNTGGDTDDLFIERVDPEDSSRYSTPEGSVPFATREETIRVKGAEPVTQIVRETRNGPVLSDVLPGAAELVGTGHVLALRWTALEPEDRTIEAGMGLARAGGWEDFETAIGHFFSPTQNALYADAEGGIGVTLAGRLPQRRSGDGSLPQPGWTGDHDWLGLLPAAANPRARDPAAGYLLNANNRLVGPDFPHHVTRDWNDDLRARRIDAVLGAAIRAGEVLDVEAMRRLQNDQRSIMALDFLPLLRAVDSTALDAASEVDGEARAILAAMASWDGESAADRPEPLIFQAWYRALVHHVLADELGERFAAYRGIRSDAMRHIIENAPEWCDDTTLPDSVQTCLDMAVRALATALKELRGSERGDWREWRWGEASRVRMAHRPLDAIFGLRRLFSLQTLGGGDAGTVAVARYAHDAPYTTVMAASLRLVADLGEASTLHAILPAGQSGHPLSPHFRDQKAAWRDGRLHRIVIADNAREARHILTLLPAD
jgi:penicillin G amidase